MCAIKDVLHVPLKKKEEREYYSIRLQFYIFYIFNGFHFSQRYDDSRFLKCHKVWDKSRRVAS